MLLSGKIPSYVAARLTARCWVPYLLRFATVRHYSRLFASIRTIQDYSHYSYYSLFETIRCSLFAIRVFETPTQDHLIVGKRRRFYMYTIRAGLCAMNYSPKKWFLGSNILPCNILRPEFSAILNWTSLEYNGFGSPF